MSEHKVSVVIPAYNQARFISDAIDSVLHQSVPAHEIIVVDNGSTDGTQMRVEMFGDAVKYLRLKKNLGPSGARNAGTKEATGDIVAYVDGDDMMGKDCIKVRTQILLSSEAVGMVVGALRIVDEKGTFIREDSILDPALDAISFERAITDLSCPTCGLFARKHALDEIGGWDESFWIAEDSDLLLRMTGKYVCMVDHDPNADYRMVGGSLSKDPKLLFDSYQRMFKKNREISENKDHYDKLAHESFEKKIINNVFGNIRNDQQGGKGGRIAKTIMHDPRLLPYAMKWLSRGAGKKLVKA